METPLLGRPLFVSKCNRQKTMDIFQVTGMFDLQYGQVFTSKYNVRHAVSLPENINYSTTLLYT
jgi:hypothetical protein